MMESYLGRDYAHKELFVHDVGSADSIRRDAWKRLAEAFRQWPGLISNPPGLSYAVRIVLGRNLAGVVTRCILSACGVLNFRSAALG